MKQYEKFTFGKHKNKKLSSVIDRDPTYILWCLTNIKGFTISKSAEIRLQEALDAKYDDIFDHFDYYDFCD